MKKIRKDKDRIKFLESQINELNEIVDGFIDETENLYHQVYDLENENKNLQNLLKNNTVVMILLAAMNIHCSRRTYYGRAFKAAINAYQTKLTEGLLDADSKSDNEDIKPFNLDEIMNENTNKDEEKEKQG